MGPLERKKSTSVAAAQKVHIHRERGKCLRERRCVVNREPGLGQIVFNLVLQTGVM